MPDSLPPERFQHFEVYRREDGTLWELGRGAMGITYKAFDTSLHSDVALKVINTALLHDDSIRERFVREARAAASLRHPNIATVFHLSTDAQSIFYAMELLVGDTLEARVKANGPLPWETVLGIADQVAKALNAATVRGIVHRDIKPANIMLVPLDGAEVVKVFDFGLAKLLQETGSRVNASFGVIGTPFFASPEQCAEEPVDARSDIYSLGATMWFLLTGETLFKGSLSRVLDSHQKMPPPWETLPAGLQLGVRGLLATMLAKVPAERPQTPTALREAIKACTLPPLTSPRPTEGITLDETLRDEGGTLLIGLVADLLVALAPLVDHSELAVLDLTPAGVWLVKDHAAAPASWPHATFQTAFLPPSSTRCVAIAGPPGLDADPGETLPGVRRSYGSGVAALAALGYELLGGRPPSARYVPLPECTETANALLRQALDGANVFADTTMFAASFKSSFLVRLPPPPPPPPPPVDEDLGERITKRWASVVKRWWWVVNRWPWVVGIAALIFGFVFAPGKCSWVGPVPPIPTPTPLPAPTPTIAPEPNPFPTRTPVPTENAEARHRAASRKFVEELEAAQEDSRSKSSTPSVNPAVVPTVTPVSTVTPKPVDQKVKMLSDEIAIASALMAVDDYISAQVAYQKALALDANSMEAKEGIEKIKQYAAKENVTGFDLKKEDPDVAARHYQMAADLGNSAGQYNLGSMYQHGWVGHPAEPEKAVKLYEQAAAQNDFDAQYNLGCMYRDSWAGHPAEPEKAVKLYEQAAAQNDSGAQYSLADMYQDGWAGHPAEPERAVKLYAAQNNAEAKYSLGFMYRHGWPGHPAEPERAVNLFEQAAAQNESNAQNVLGLYWNEGWPRHPADPIKAVKYFRLSADQNNPIGQCDLAYAYEKGNGVPKNLKAAIELYKKAAAQEQEEAKKRLKALGVKE